jgi:hypothetical protein
MTPKPGPKTGRPGTSKELEPHMNETPKETASGKMPAERKKALFLWL